MDNSRLNTHNVQKCHETLTIAYTDFSTLNTFPAAVGLFHNFLDERSKILGLSAEHNMGYSCVRIKELSWRTVKMATFYYAEKR